jgi:sugar/nucleoside kinase (ribokinase family)
MIEKSPDYLVIGHICKDLLDTGGFTAGGTALYSAITAQRLGMQAAVVTACAPADDALLDLARREGVWIERVASPFTTVFQNYYDRWGNRTQVLGGQAGMLRFEDVPPEWLDAKIIHLGPVAQELPEGMPRRLGNVQILGVTPQGWMRYWDSVGTITHSASPVPQGLEGLPSNAFVVVSMEDLGHRPDKKKEYSGLAGLVAVTNGKEEACLYHSGASFTVPAFHADMIDPTGAGDVFATALFTRYLECGDLMEAARFAHAAAALNIERRGVAAVPYRSEVERRVAGDQ